jgi:hypothetical protein
VSSGAKLDGVSLVESAKGRRTHRCGRPVVRYCVCLLQSCSYGNRVGDQKPDVSVPNGRKTVDTEIKQCPTVVHGAATPKITCS